MTVVCAVRLKYLADLSYCVHKGMREKNTFCQIRQPKLKFSASLIKKE